MPVFAVFLLLFLSGCASRTDSFRTELLYRHVSLNREQFSNQSILILPSIMDSSFVSSGILSTDSLRKLLSSVRTDMRPCPREEFERACLQKFEKRTLNGFYTDIVHGDILALQTSDSVWSHMPCKYLLTLRVAYGARVRTFEKKLMRSVRVEAELWDTENIEVVWRAETRGAERDAKTDDSQFLREAILHLLGQLPAYKPSSNEKNW